MKRKQKVARKATKFSIAVDIIGQNPGADRAVVVELIRSHFDTNRKNANMYYGRWLHGERVPEVAQS
ncbi:MAG: hypothetical protein DRI69_10050 [Bacteroidetes bacterium]|nr:MAG: hypothetical protein DRI69_10050 [Bacteroidota bacterium]